jgi:hypothetical protein
MKDIPKGNELPPNVDQVESHDAEEKTDKSPEKSTPIAFHKGYIVLPTHDLTGGAYGKNEEKYPLEGKDTEFRPEIFGSAILLGNNQHFAPPKSIDEKQTWMLKGADGTRPLATFRIENGEWLFQWDRNADTTDVGILRRCLIRLEPAAKPILMSKPFEVIEGCLLPDTKPSQVDLSSTELEGIEQCLSKLSLGKWTFNDLPPEYKIIGIESVLSPTTTQRTVQLKFCIDQIDIAELHIELRPKDSKDKESPWSIVEIKLMATIPAIDGKDGALKLWAEKTRNDEKNDLSLAILTKKMSENEDKKKGDEAWIAFAESAWDTNGKVTEKGKPLIPDRRQKKQLDPNLTLDASDDLNSVELQNRKNGLDTRRASIQHYVSQHENLNTLKTWREGMDELTRLLETKVTLSFDVFYDVKIDDMDVPVILGTVTTKLPVAP